MNEIATQTLADKLKAGFAEGEFVKDGRVIAERALAEQLDVGRRALRKALDQLESEGLIWRRQGQGTFVGTPPTPRLRKLEGLATKTSPFEIMEVRQEIEPSMARFAALRASQGDIDAMRSMVEKAASATTQAEYEKWDAAFHQRLAESVKNTLFLAVFEAVNAVRREAAWARLRESSHSDTLIEELSAQHRDIINAIEQRDPKRAEDAMRRHLSEVEHALKQT
ncbi:MULTISPECIES: FadR/GntR family transcriptional regulator [Thalassospira]|jgi:GntR family transcriptional repressor for pyruvate dehydrogenase complex|uniref:FadR/GntR family transcriptional regulator n=1 Tax=Thalassospira TaxID=168934 RepID=UPI000C38DCBA|nr:MULTISPECIES: FadR/GntR family transcriptional regulator [Thalassospira]MBC44314.1 GntR family transcriptional regulator [Thalassospira sp.]MBO6806463.1 FadR family transcriptional regulator [Thalassospira sp.]MBO6839016.1 FadR family transcriptional regulator [Thalassospira sp.]MBS8275054.1 FadR family transcriptional regulator [Thalassospira tepidiphila]|tara:strand:- start:523 stop:1194 length:672 start_codon:yes stop_codon:yes gene_type:complete